MSWQLAAFLILFLALAGGFAWFERGRADARVIALVATLAAFAALGRIAFAALPNIKPTTDIVLIAGYALGPAPGFVVGALGGLTSNFFFGQGPWTPWQMAAWGATGLIGATLGSLTGHRIGRWPLAIACLVVGFGFTAVQDVGDWVNYSDHSLGALKVYVGKGLGFDAVHAAGCAAFALAFGPALARSLARFATRLNVTWRSSGSVVGPLVAVAALAGLVSGTSGISKPGVAPAQAAASPTVYLLSAQNRDGGFGPAPGQPSTQLFSGWAALGLAAVGENPDHLSRGGPSLIGYLRFGVHGDTDPGAIERTILAAAAAGQNPRRFGGRDLVAALRSHIGRDGSVSDQTNLTAFAVLALRATGTAPPRQTVHWLLAQEDRDGGFNYATAGGPSDVDDTAAVLEALAPDPIARATRARARAAGFIERQQNRDGGFPATPGAGSNAQSTAWAIQGLLSARVDPAALHRRGAPNPAVYLESLLAPDGHIRYARSADQTPVWVTSEAMMALAGKVLPLTPLRRRPRPARPDAAQPQRRPARARHTPRHRARRRPAHPSAVTLGLASDAGILDALLLAPIGVG